MQRYVTVGIGLLVGVYFHRRPDCVNSRQLCENRVDRS
jgi:hypothetical protein